MLVHGPGLDVQKKSDNFNKNGRRDSKRTSKKHTKKAIGVLNREGFGGFGVNEDGTSKYCSVCGQRGIVTDSRFFMCLTDGCEKKGKLQNRDGVGSDGIAKVGWYDMRQILNPTNSDLVGRERSSSQNRTVDSNTAVRQNARMSVSSSSQSTRD